MSKKKRKIPADNILSENIDDIDDRFAFIAGYTPGGFPYGTTWEEPGIDPALPLEEKVEQYNTGDYNMIQMHKPLTPSQKEKLERLHMRLCQIQEEIEDLANETGNEDIINASLNVLDTIFCLGNADEKHSGDSCEQGAAPADGTVIEVADSELPF